MAQTKIADNAIPVLRAIDDALASKDGMYIFFALRLARRFVNSLVEKEAGFIEEGDGAMPLAAYAMNAEEMIAMFQIVLAESAPVEESDKAVITLLCDHNLNYWFSPMQWNHAPSGKKAQPARWEYLGSPGFAPTEDHHKRREEIFAIFGDMVPEYHNEYAEIEVPRKLLEKHLT